MSLPAWKRMSPLAAMVLPTAVCLNWFDGGLHASWWFCTIYIIQLPAELTTSSAHGLGDKLVFNKRNGFQTE